MDLKNIKIAFYTLGCKVNIYETGVMENGVLSEGAEVVPFSEKADIYVVNTCSVTNIADRKSRQIIHRAKKMNPEAIIVAAGCYAETEEEEKLLETGADFILGNEEKKRIGELLASYVKNRAIPERSDISRVELYSKETLPKMLFRTRADVKVQDGCNQFCTYCIIPYARGRIRSKALPDALSEIRTLAREGVKEIVLTGIHLSSYGKDFPDEKPGLLELIKAVHAEEGVKRIRLGSLEPRIITEDFVSELSRLPKLCPHFHLSLQSGSGTVLRRMNRHYSPEEYRQGVSLLRKYFQHPALTTDVIVGFPGETEEEFRETVRFIEEVGFYELHVFQYSRRKGTRADKMPDQIPENVKKERSETLIALGKRMSERYEESMTGENVEVLTEERTASQDWISGYTKEYIRVEVPARFKENRIVQGVLRKNHGKNILDDAQFCEGEAR